MQRLVFSLLAMGILSGCAGGQQHSGEWPGRPNLKQPAPCEPLTQEQTLAISVVQDLMDSDQLYAAFANLELLPAQLPEARVRKAKVLRLLGRSQAANKQFRALVRSCKAAEGWHGLGQLAVARGEYPQAVGYLRKAVALAPVEAPMRNDLGVAYLHQRSLAEASFELRTAMELDNRDSRAAVNYVTLLLYGNDWDRARELVARYGIGPAQFAEAQARASRMQAEDRMHLDGSSPASAPAPSAPAAAPQPPVAPTAASVAPVSPRAAAPAAAQTNSVELPRQAPVRSVRAVPAAIPLAPASSVPAAAQVPPASASAFSLRAPASVPPVTATPMSVPAVPILRAPAQPATAIQPTAEGEVQRIQSQSPLRILPPGTVPVITD